MSVLYFDGDGDVGLLPLESDYFPDNSDSRKSNLLLNNCHLTNMPN